jgi:hypothetical protein
MKGLIRNYERWAGPNIICIGALYKIDLHLATNFTREVCHLFDTLEEMCLHLLLIRKIPVTPNLP